MYINFLIIFGAKYLFLISGLIYVLFSLFLLNTDRKNFKKFITLSIICFPLVYVAAKLFGMVIIDPRPFLVSHTKPLIESAIDNGFPSDHTLLAMAFASIVFLFQKKIGVLLTLLALLIGSARVLAGVHHPLDVIGSLGIAISITLIVYTCSKSS